MFTSLTLSAISLLHEINAAAPTSEERSGVLASPESCAILEQLERAHILYVQPGSARGYLTSYRLSRSLGTISLLELLDALGESLNNTHLVGENFYMEYGIAARKLGVINHVTRSCLSGIHVSDVIANCSVDASVTDTE